MNAQLKASPIPLKIAELRKLMDKEDKLAAQLQPIKKRIDALREELINLYIETKTDSNTAHGLRVTRVNRDVPSVKDVEALNAYRTKKANWDLIPNSVPVGAWRERLADKQAVPGVVPFTDISVSVTRVEKKAKNGK